MHPNPVFCDTPTHRNLAFARERGFGVLSVNGGAGPLVAHVPFVVNDEGTEAYLHLMRSNPIARALEQDLPAVLAVSGPDGYVSPDWYDLPDQVPTWNYVAVHLRGSLTRMADIRLREVLDLLSAEFEARLAPKPAWLSAKMAPDAMNRMMRMIQPVKLEIGSVDGTWKLNQNKPEAARMAAAEAMPDGIGQELAVLSTLMRMPPE